jgi:hypothetical protein
VPGIGGTGTVKANTVRVKATDTSHLDAHTGTLSASILGAAGASFALNTMNNTVEAFIDGASVRSSVGDVDVTATSNNDVSASALGLSVAGLIAGVGSVSVNDLSNTTSASLRNGAKVDSAAGLLIRANDSSPVTADSGGLAASLGAGVGASVALNTLSNTVEAFSDSADATVAGQLDFNAASSNNVDALALGFGAGGVLGGFVTVTMNKDNTTTDATSVKTARSKRRVSRCTRATSRA